MRVLVIGGTRFIGPHLVRGLVEDGHDVAALHRGRTALEVDGAREILGDRAALADPGSPEAAAARAFAPEVVVDMIAMTEADAHATVEAFRGVARRLVVASSMDVYRAYSRLHRREDGEPLPTPFDEDGPLRALRYPYRGTDFARRNPETDLERYEKLDVERVVLGEPELPGTVLRLPAVYGANDANHRLFDPLKRMDDGREVIALPESYAPWLWAQGYVENVAHALALATVDDRAAGRVYNAGPAETPTVRETVEALGRAVRWTVASRCCRTRRSHRRWAAPSTFATTSRATAAASAGSSATPSRSRSRRACGAPPSGSARTRRSASTLGRSTTRRRTRPSRPGRRERARANRRRGRRRRRRRPRGARRR